MGFGPGVRVTAYIVLACLATGNLLIRIPVRVNRSKERPPNIIQFFKDPAYVTFVSGLVTFLPWSSPLELT